MQGARPLTAVAREVRPHLIQEGDYEREHDVGAMTITAPTPRKPQQRDLFTRRWSNAKAKDPAEIQIQISVVAQCKWRLRDGVKFWHTPNGEARDKATGAKLKAMGVLAGVADLLFMWANLDGATRVLFLELKAKGKTRSEEQHDFCAAVRACGCDYFVADNVDDAMRILRDAGLLKR